MMRSRVAPASSVMSIPNNKLVFFFLLSLLSVSVLWHSQILSFGLRTRTRPIEDRLWLLSDNYTWDESDLVAYNVIVRYDADLDDMDIHCRHHRCLQLPFEPWGREGSGALYITSMKALRWPAQSLNRTERFRSLGSLLLYTPQAPGRLRYGCSANAFHSHNDLAWPIFWIAHSLLRRDVSRQMLQNVTIATSCKKTDAFYTEGSPGRSLLQLFKSDGLRSLSSIASWMVEIASEDPEGWNYSFDRAVLFEPPFWSPRLGSMRIAYFQGDMNKPGSGPRYINKAMYAEWRKARTLVRAVSSIVVDWASLAQQRPRNRALIIVRGHSRRFLSAPNRPDMAPNSIAAWNRIFQNATTSDELKRQLFLLWPGIYLQFVSLGNLSFKRQVQLSSSSAVIAGMHGAGLTNFIYAQPCSICLQLLSYGMAKYFSGRAIFQSTAAVSRCTYAEFTFGASRSTHGSHKEPFQYVVPITGNQNYEKVNVEVHVTPDDFVDIIKLAAEKRNASAHCKSAA